ncbi:recombinase family protein [Fusibacter sp. JL216-2]|uniref:recombinase family protein n=1 Tax=Fusibacter sp. JL216-2 TaxID=3071453 RepID=UPI003D343CAC
MKTIERIPPKNEVKNLGARESLVRVAPYCRVSKSTEEQLTSFSNQKSHYERLISNKDEWKLVRIYADEGISGTKTANRHEFNRMFEDAMNGKIDLIITKSISRFARNVVDTITYVRALKDRGVRIIFENENIDTMAMEGELMLTILSAVAQMYVENLSESVNWSLKKKMEKGELVGFSGCLGYDYDTENQKIIINEKEAKIVRLIFSRYLGGAGCYTIANELKKIGYKTKKGSSRWHESTVRAILKNEKYCGDVLQGKTFTTDALSHNRVINKGQKSQYMVRNNHEPIIEREVFNEAAKIMEDRRKAQNLNGQRQRHSQKYAFSKKISCGYCGSSYIRRKHHSSSKYEHYSWTCIKPSKGFRRECPHSKSVREDIIEQAFIECFNILLSESDDVIASFLKTVEESLKNVDHSKKLKSLNHEISKVKDKMDNLVKLKIESKINIEVYEKNNSELEMELDALNKQREKLENYISENASISDRIKKFSVLLKNNKLMSEFDREIFETIISNIIIGGKNEYGIDSPYLITFILKTGAEMTVDVDKKKNC